MSSDIINTPVVFFIFNRPDLTAKVFAAIEKAQPTKLYIIADGPRSIKEASLTETTRNVVENINWECEVIRHYSEKNMGCDNRIISGLDLVFDSEEMAIILEDDCYPDQTFFTFCQTLLYRYQSDHTVFHISGNNFQDGRTVGDGDYYFSKYPHIWGWATWKRAWKRFDKNLAMWPIMLKNKAFQEKLGAEHESKFWRCQFDALKSNESTLWDALWLFSVWANNGKCILPNKNLVKNLGFRADATRTTSENASIQNIGLESLLICRTPTIETINTEADLYTFNRNFSSHQKVSIVSSVINSIKKSLKYLLNGN